MTGLSYTNIQYMQRFAKSCCEIYPQLVGKLEQLSFLSKNLQKLIFLTQVNLNFIVPKQNGGNS
jgi:hypothetical protein